MPADRVEDEDAREGVEDAVHRDRLAEGLAEVAAEQLARGAVARRARRSWSRAAPHARGAAAEGEAVLGVHEQLLDVVPLPEELVDVVVHDALLDGSSRFSKASRRSSSYSGDDALEEVVLQVGHRARRVGRQDT